MEQIQKHFLSIKPEMQGAGSFFSQQNIVSISESEKESLRTQSHSGDSSQALSATKR